MDIFVQTLTGSRNKLRFTVDKSDTIDAVKLKIQNMQRIAPDRQCLYLAGKQLEGGFSLAHYDVQPGATLVLVHNLVDQFDNPNHYSYSSKLAAAGASATASRARARARDDSYRATDGSGGAPEYRNLVALMEKRAAASKMPNARGLSRQGKTLCEGGKIQKTATSLDAPADRAGKIHASELEKVRSYIAGLSSQVKELTNSKADSEAKLSLLSRVNEQLREELVAVRKEHKYRDLERAAELDVLKEEKQKYKDDRNALREKLEVEKQKTLCQICFSRPRDSLIFPCSHLHYCFLCLQQHQEQKRTCPTCRTSISSVLKCNVSIS